MTSNPRSDFFWDLDEPVPHLGQQRALLKKYPQLKELMGYEPKTKYILCSVVLLQTFLAWYLADKSWTAILVVSYLVGAVCNSNMFLVTHELCHRLASPSRNVNKLLTVIANFPIGIPFGMTFGPYHIEHHMFMGQDGLDTDIPTEKEAMFFANPSYSYPRRCFMKFLFMTTQIFFYALRPLFVRPETTALAARDPWYIFNALAQYSYDAFLIYNAGFSSIIYLLLSTFWAGSFHPVAGHFLAEHYVFDGNADIETFSYYGFWNIFTYNSGYHNIHHDLPNIPWSRLPQAREICKDYYDSLPECKSWGWCIVKYIFDDSVGPFSRKKRPTVLLPTVKTHTQMMEKFLKYLDSKAFSMNGASNAGTQNIETEVSQENSEVSNSRCSRDPEVKPTEEPQISQLIEGEAVKHDLSPLPMDRIGI